MPLWGKSENEVRLETRVSHLNDDVARLNSQIGLLERDNQAMRDDKRRAEETAQDRLARISVLDSDVKSLELKIEERDRDLERLNRQVAGRKTDLEEEKRRVAGLRNDNSARAAELQASVAAAASLEGEKGRVEEEARHLRARIQQLEADLGQQKTLTEARGKDASVLAVKHSSAEQRVHGLEKQQQALEAGAREKDARLEDVKAERARLERDMAAHLKEVVHLKETKARLEASVLELERRERQLTEQAMYQQRVYDEKEKEMRRGQDAALERMDRTRKEEMETHVKSHEKTLATLTGSNQAVVTQLLENSKAKDQTVDKVLDFMLAQQKQNTEFMMNSMQRGLPDASPQQSIGQGQQSASASGTDDFVHMEG